METRHMNYFDYNANKYLPKGQSSRAAFEVTEAPTEWQFLTAGYYIVEHGEVTREMWDSLTPVKL
jgi:hypothetical protein